MFIGQILTIDMSMERARGIRLHDITHLENSIQSIMIDIIEE